MAVWSARSAGFPSSILGKFRAGFHLLGGFSNPGKPISSHERIEVAGEHPIHVSHLKLGAMVLHQLVGLKRVGADLAAEADLRLSLVELPSLLPALGELMLVQTRAKDLHGHLAVFVLAALVLALHYNAGGERRDSHSRVGNVDVLAGMITGAVGLQAQVFGFDDDVYIVVCFWYH